VKRAAFAEMWEQETGTCMREMALEVGIRPVGLGLIFLPPVCGIMTAALPGMTTQFRGGHMRHEIEGFLAAGDLHSTLRDRIVTVAEETGRSARAPNDAASRPSGATPDSLAVLQPDAILEATVIEVRIRDDGTLSSVSARARMLRASDRVELVTRLFTHQVAAGEPWHQALEPALAALSVAIVEAMIPAPRPDAARGAEAEPDPRTAHTADRDGDEP
jgi:hypothetical protein